MAVRWEKPQVTENCAQKEEIFLVEDKDLSLEKDFYITEISDALFKKMQGKSFKDNCTIPRSDLRYLHVLHKTLEGTVKDGELVCNVKIADILLDIFKELYSADYPIEKIHLIDEYDADDERSMSDNNSSCFNFRFISHTKVVSKHGAGLAVDINPLYNPYYKFVNGKPNLEPANSGEYLDRSKNFPYKIDHNDLAYKLFTSRGFEWGGDWQDCKDWQHFEFKN
ncbi:M15 family metallopeptidase [uncultured Treponema sp.]|uniref:M15 family metallopeptidase n=1 Tax=uncultured Treponema sp. TaxID=162155 RepID=UPI0025FD7B7A|nr:M15 family metallopeptidase [uncultured Treponema sp.]